MIEWKPVIKLVGDKANNCVWGDAWVTASLIGAVSKLVNWVHLLPARWDTVFSGNFQQINQQLCVDECMYVYFINVGNLLEIDILLLPVIERVRDGDNERWGNGWDYNWVSQWVSVWTS